MLYLVMALAAALGFWLVWAYMDRFHAGRQPPPSAPETGTLWHEVLGVGPDASPDDVRAAYLREIGKYHPDRVASMAPEFRALAEQRSMEINRAYAECMATSSRAG
jgi:DnaJ like chaperone protein